MKNLRKEYNDFLLKDISFDIEEGDVVGFVGQNGAGKSTTMKLILNMLKKDGGDIEIFGLDHMKHEEEIKDRIGFVFDSNYFYEDLRIDESVQFFSAFYEKWDNQLINYYLQTFELNPKKKIKELSKGMKMKFALAVSLSHDADFYLMDEASTGLDPLSREQLLDIILEINKTKNKTFLFSSHIISDIEKIANKIIFIHDGEIIMNGTKKEIKERFYSVKGNLEDFHEKVAELSVGYKKWEDFFVGLISKEHKPVFEEMNLQIEPASLEDIIIFHTRGKSNEKTFEII
ncbi:ABC transporter ATP-binding protein [Bacillus sp. M6-12]|uniref:ABC transporter ATP-binding protein n=1 Tax=Bacillus sp. M6-12 TaxID=2054166 RepID=UPI002154FAFC|nr:ABC transporter ATP-binding protein [Bacillus sp. M6-12]